MTRSKMLSQTQVLLQHQQQQMKDQNFLNKNNQDIASYLTENNVLLPHHEIVTNQESDFDFTTSTQESIDSTKRLTRSSSTRTTIDSLKRTESKWSDSKEFCQSLLEMNLRNNGRRNNLKSESINTTKTSLPKLKNVIPKSSFCSLISDTNLNTDSLKNVSKCDFDLKKRSSDHWSISSLKDAKSQFNIANSETSSNVSTCSSSDHETNDLINGVTNEDASPGSPDSGVSGSINSNDLDDFYSPTTPLKDKQNDHHELNFSEQSKCEQVLLDNFSSNVEPVFKKPETFRKEISAPSVYDLMKIINSINRKSKNNKSDSFKEITAQSIANNEKTSGILKKVNAVIQSLPKGFDTTLKALTQDPDTYQEENLVNDSTKIVNDNDNSPQPFDFGFDFPIQEESTPSQTFDWSIKAKGASDMQEMIEQLKTNARTIKMNDANKSKPRQSFFCKWHDCDWPGNYEDLAEHLREIHVELQPFLDSNGKVIEWNKRKMKAFNESTNDDFDGSSQATDLDYLDSDAESCITEDDRSSRISFPTTRRSRRFCNGSDSSENSRAKKNTSEYENNKSEKFVCLWRGCKVFGKPSLSRSWIERHVLEQHSGPKPFKCIVDGCGQRFRAQNQLEKHVNMHFKSNDSNNCHSSSTDLKTVSTTANASSNAKECCKCDCHSTNCDNNPIIADGNDTNNTAFNILNKKIRLEKTNRSSSVDSRDSLQSCSSASSSNSLSSVQSSSQQSLSEQIDQYCHTTCCCVLQKSNLDAKTSSKVPKPKNESYFSLPLITREPYYDLMEDERLKLELEFQFRTYNALKSNLKCYPSYDKCIVFSNGDFIKVKNDECLNVVLEELSRIREQNCDKKDNLSFQVYNVFNPAIFENFEEDSITFQSKIIAYRRKLPQKKSCFVIRWFPEGIFEDEILTSSELRLKKNMIRTVSYSKLNNIKKSFAMDVFANKSRNESKKLIKNNISLKKKNKNEIDDDKLNMKIVKHGINQLELEQQQQRQQQEETLDVEYVYKNSNDELYFLNVDDYRRYNQLQQHQQDEELNQESSDDLETNDIQYPNHLDILNCFLLKNEASINKQTSTIIIDPSCHILNERLTIIERNIDSNGDSDDIKDNTGIIVIRVNGHHEDNEEVLNFKRPVQDLSDDDIDNNNEFKRMRVDQ